MLADAKAQCDILVVGLHVDPSLERKSKNKPVMTLDERVLMLQALKYVDEIKIYETEDDLAEILWALRPDVRILGSDWKGRQDEVTAINASKRIHWHKRTPGWSSSEMRQRIWKAENER